MSSRRLNKEDRKLIFKSFLNYSSGLQDKVTALDQIEQELAVKVLQHFVGNNLITDYPVREENQLCYQTKIVSTTRYINAFTNKDFAFDQELHYSLTTANTGGTVSRIFRPEKYAPNTMFNTSLPRRPNLSMCALKTPPTVRPSDLSSTFKLEEISSLNFRNSIYAHLITCYKLGQVVQAMYSEVYKALDACRTEKQLRERYPLLIEAFDKTVFPQRATRARNLTAPEDLPSNEDIQQSIARLVRCT